MTVWCLRKSSCFVSKDYIYTQLLRKKYSGRWCFFILSKCFFSFRHLIKDLKRSIFLLLRPLNVLFWWLCDAIFTIYYQTYRRCWWVLGKIDLLPIVYSCCVPSYKLSCIDNKGVIKVFQKVGVLTGTDVHRFSSFFVRLMFLFDDCVMRSLLHNTKHIGGADEYLERLIFCQ